MQKLDLPCDPATVLLLEQLASRYYHRDESQTVRAALQSLASRVGHEGWVIAGYTPVTAARPATCHSCGDPHSPGDLLFRPVFRREENSSALPSSSAMPRK